MSDKAIMHRDVTASARKTMRRQRSGESRFHLPIWVLGFAIAVMFLRVAPAAGQTVSWVMPSNQTGSWSDPTNWSGVVPTSNVDALIVNGGTANIPWTGGACKNLTLGSSAGSGAIQMDAGNLSIGDTVSIGNGGAGTITQTEWTNNVGYAVSLGALGTYNLLGTGQLSAMREDVGGTFVQSGGANTVSYILFSVQGGGSYNLSGTGQLSTVNADEIIGSGTFTQSGGVNTIGGNLRVGLGGAGGGSNGTYNLSDTGQVSASAQYIGSDSADTALFHQTGGTNTTGYLSIASGGQYQLNGGTLQVTGGFSNGGVFDAGGGTFSLSSTNCIVDLSGGSVQNAKSLSLNIGANSLLIVSPTFDSTAFGSYSCSGLVHVAGSTLSLSPSQGFGGTGSINDPVNCQGTITATSGGFINLNNGLVLSGSGVASLGNGILTINDTTSNMSGGSLSAYQQKVGSGGTGTFTQSGGTNATNYGIVLGDNTTDNGTYFLNSTGKVSCQWYEMVGYFGSGTFSQSGGTNTIMPGGELLVGYINGSSGTYYLSNGILSSSEEDIGPYGTGVFDQSGGSNALSTGTLRVGGCSQQQWGNGTYLLRNGTLGAGLEIVGVTNQGTFTQSGGTNTISNALRLGDQTGGNGTYNLNGGTLILAAINVGAGTATFNFGGGTLQANASFSTTLPMTLTGIGGNANIDTAGNAVALSGQLSGVGGLNKLGAGTLTLSGANIYAGTTTVSAGTLALGANNALPTGSNVILGGGTLAANGFSQTNRLGALALIADSTIDMGVTSNSILDFADSHSTAWAGMLTITDWNGSLSGGGADELFFGSSALGLTLGQLNEIVFVNPNGLQGDYQATILATGEIVPVPEPTTLALLASGGLLLGGFALRSRRRRTA
jgi:autotransporter-associated beta strand protein